jgi:hypothetical protein
MGIRLPFTLSGEEASKLHQTVSAVYDGRMFHSAARATPVGLSLRLVRSTSAATLPEQASCYRQSQQPHESAPNGEVRLHKAFVTGPFLDSS